MARRGGILTDSASRPGKPLRDILRATRGVFPGARQMSNRRWFIDAIDGAARDPIPTAASAVSTPDAGQRERALVIREDVERLGFVGYVSVSSLLEWGLPVSKSLDQCGIYVILTPAGYHPQFRTPEAARAGGNVIAPWPVSRLEGKWVPDAEVVYIGCAGTRSPRTLRTRIRDLVRHSAGKTTDRGPHQGGEIVWQLDGYEDFVIAWVPTDGPPEPRSLEAGLIAAFEAARGQLPFANRQR